MILLSAIIETFEAEFLADYQGALLPSQRQALAAMKQCRTSLSPVMLAQCDDCEQQRFVPHSCGHRSCPHRRLAYPFPSPGFPSACASGDAGGRYRPRQTVVANQTRQKRPRQKPNELLVQSQGPGQGLPRQTARSHHPRRFGVAGSISPKMGCRCQVRRPRRQSFGVSGALSL